MKPTFIILHHSTTRDSETFSWAAIRRHHTQTLGWRKVGYHFGIELIGKGYETILGRFMNEKGAHCRQGSMNHYSLGTCCVGNFDKEAPSGAQWNLCLALTHSLMETMGIPKEHVLGHREVARDGRSCPGWLWDMDKFREDLGHF